MNEHSLPISYNYRSTLRMKSSVLLFLLQYTSIIRPSITYACPILATATSTKINRIQLLQNKFLTVCVKAPWSTRNRQRYRNPSTPRLDNNPVPKTSTKKTESIRRRTRFDNLGNKTKKKKKKSTTKTTFTARSSFFPTRIQAKTKINS